LLEFAQYKDSPDYPGLTPRRLDGEGAMSDPIMTVFCIAAGSGLRFYQLAALLWWILQQKPPTNAPPPG
jgi:hypothetical protein